MNEHLTIKPNWPKWLNCVVSTYLSDAFDCKCALHGFTMKRVHNMIRIYSPFTHLSSNFSVGAWKTIFIYFLCIMISFLKPSFYHIETKTWRFEKTFLSGFHLINALDVKRFLPTSLREFASVSFIKIVN